VSPVVEHFLTAWWEAERAKRDRPWQLYKNAEARTRCFQATMVAEQTARDELFAEIERAHPPMKDTYGTYGDLPIYARIPIAIEHDGAPSDLEPDPSCA
jgi:hypothetical protein